MLVCFHFLHARLRVRPASGLPCALRFPRDTPMQDSGETGRENANAWLVGCSTSHLPPLWARTKCGKSCDPRFVRSSPPPTGARLLDFPKRGDQAGAETNNNQQEQGGFARIVHSSCPPETRINDSNQITTCTICTRRAGYARAVPVSGETGHMRVAARGRSARQAKSPAFCRASHANTSSGRASCIDVHQAVARFRIAT